MAKQAGIVVCLVAAGGLLAGCEGTSNQQLGVTGGAVVGGVAGALLGRQIGGGATGAVIGGIVGAGLGSLAGGAIAQRLSAREQEQAAASTQRVLDAPARPGRRESWVSPETPNTRGSSELVRVTEGGNCRMVREVAIVQGEEVRQESRFCRASDGRWVRA